jgi:hypothetical protein
MGAYRQWHTTDAICWFSFEKLEILTHFINQHKSTGIKAARKTWMKLNPVVNFNNVLQAACSPISCAKKLQS